MWGVGGPMGMGQPAAGGLGGTAAAGFEGLQSRMALGVKDLGGVWIFVILCAEMTELYPVGWCFRKAQLVNFKDSFEEGGNSNSAAFPKGLSSEMLRVSPR